jgi:surface polysaccharide O-acyltransferase-like enzyme
MLIRKMTGIFLLLLVAVPLFFSIGFIIKQRNIQVEMKQELKTALLQTIIVPARDVKWIKKDKEILVNGQMFDVKTSVKSGENIVFTGLYDKDEQKLHENLKGFMHSKNKQSAPLNELLAKFFSTTVTITAIDYNTAADWKHIAAKYYYPSEKIPFAYGISIYQPPRF